jgi:hypothetical protein
VARDGNEGACRPRGQDRVVHPALRGGRAGIEHCQPLSCSTWVGRRGDDAAIAVLVVGVSTWAWSVGLILSKVPHKELITGGLFSVVKHPLYTSVALLVLPWAGFLVNSWLGAAIGVVMYVGCRIFAPAEGVELSRQFGEDWAKYCSSVKIPWLRRTILPECGRAVRCRRNLHFQD